MLTETQKRIINGVLEDYSELKSIRLSLEKRTADVSISVTPDEETNNVREMGDFSWRDARNQRYTLRLSGICKIAISSHTEKLPPEIKPADTPTPEFILFLASLFEQQGIYEWNCFENPANRFKHEWRANWVYEFPTAMTTQSDCILFFKERQKSVWVIGLWFSKLEIEGNFDENNFGSVEELAAKFPTRLGTNP